MRLPAITPTADKTPHTQGFWHSRYALGLAVLGAVAGYFLLTEHLAHTLGVLPYVLLAACPLMHLFMHHGHSEHVHPAESGKSSEPVPPTKPVDAP